MPMRRSSARPRTKHQKLLTSCVFQAVAQITRLIDVFSYVPQIPRAGALVGLELVAIYSASRIMPEAGNTSSRGDNSGPLRGAWPITPVRVRILIFECHPVSGRLSPNGVVNLGTLNRQCPLGDCARCGSTPAAAVKHNPADETNQDFPSLRQAVAARACIGHGYVGCRCDSTGLPGPIIGHGLGQYTGL